MPTGYTADVQSGKIETFQEYAIGCARAFGATIMMRDDPKDAPIPEAFEPETKYHEDRLSSAESILKEELTIEDAEAMATEDHNKALARFEESKIDNKVRLDRYNSMLAKTKAWVAPTNEHQEFKKFMVGQLESSINWDIHEPEEPTRSTGAELIEERIKSAKRDIEYHTEKIAEEIERTEGRNLWISNLRQSLVE